MKSSTLHWLLLKRIELELVHNNEVLSSVFVGRETCDDISFLVDADRTIGELIISFCFSYSLTSMKLDLDSLEIKDIMLGLGVWFS